MSCQNLKANFLSSQKPLAASCSKYTHCSGDSIEKLSTNIWSEYVSDFCHDKKVHLKWRLSLLNNIQFVDFVDFKAELFYFKLIYIFWNTLYSLITLKPLKS